MKREPNLTSEPMIALGSSLPSMPLLPEQIRMFISRFASGC